MARKPIEVDNPPNVRLAMSQAFDDVDDNFRELYSRSTLNSYIVGNGAQYTTISSAVSAAGSRIRTRKSLTHTITATNGSPTVTAVGSTWRTPLSAGALGVGDLWKPDANSRYYKIKSVDSDTQLTLWENFADTTISGVSTAYSTYYLDVVTLLLLPGHHQAAGVALSPGINFVGLGRNETFISELSGTPATPFDTWSENSCFNLTFAPTENWGDMDGVTASVLSTIWAGAKAEFNNVAFQNTNARAAHQGGTLRIPLLRAGFTEYTNCQFRVAKTPTFEDGGAVVASNTNTRVLIRNTSIECVLDSDSMAGIQIYPDALAIDVLANYQLDNVHIYLPDYAQNPLVSPVGAIVVQAACSMDMNKVTSRVANTNAGDNCRALDIGAAATVNMTFCDLEASGTNGTAVYNNGGTVNARHSRFKGSTNSINNVAGTVNAAGSVTTIGATAGVITASET